MIIVISGVKGSGKSTVTQLIKKKYPEVKIFNFGDYVKKIIEKKYPKLTRDQWDKKIPLGEQEEFQVKTAKVIAKEAKKSKLNLIDTNLLLKKPTGFFPGLKEETLKILKPDTIAIMEFKPEDILERRLKDLSLINKNKTKVGTTAEHRERDIETKEDIELEQTMQREFLISCSTITGASLEIINLRFKERHDFEHAEIAANKIIEILRS
jgi:adenylate kinase